MDVRGIDRADSFTEDIDYRICDLLDAASIPPHLDGVDAVLHLAAIPAPGRSSNADIFQINTAGTFNVYDACAQVGVDRVCVASSINAIGYFFGAVPFEIEYLPVDEEHPKYTSDAYSFSKQVTEQIGQYFWRRDGISSTSLRFGTGLSPVEELKQKLAVSCSQARELVESLFDSDHAGREIRRMREGYDRERRDRNYEKGLGRTSELTPVEHHLMTLRHNYFAFVTLEDACHSMELSLSAPFRGSHALFIVDRTNILGLDAARLVNLIYPDVPVNGKLEGRQSLVDWRKADALLKYTTNHSADVLYEGDRN